MPNNNETFNRLLQPSDAANAPLWQQFLSNTHDHLVWYPGLPPRFPDMDYSFSGLNNHSSEPDAYLVTAAIPDPMTHELITNNMVNTTEAHITLLEKAELNPRGWDYGSEVSYPLMKQQDALTVALALDNRQVLEEFFMRDLQRQTNRSERGLGRLLQPKSTSQIIAEMGQYPHFALTGRIFLLSLQVEKDGNTTHKSMICAFIDSAVFMKVFVARGGLNVAAIAP